MTKNLNVPETVEQPQTNRIVNEINGELTVEKKNTDAQTALASIMNQTFMERYLEDIRVNDILDQNNLLLLAAISALAKESVWGKTWKRYSNRMYYYKMKRII